MFTSFFPDLAAYCQARINEWDQITPERETILQDIAHFLADKIQRDQSIAFTVICTHNSRRSHLAQAWIYAASEWWNWSDISSFSGGTEATAFHPNAVAALRRAGFDVQQLEESSNPTYELKVSFQSEASTHFSKRFDAPSNPQAAFAAILVCSDADEACPFVPGAERRFYLPFEDPKAFDGTDQVDQAYDQCAAQIAREIFFIFQTADQLMTQLPTGSSTASTEPSK